MLWPQSCTIGPHRAPGSHPAVFLGHSRTIQFKELRMRVRQVSDWVSRILVLALSATCLVLSCEENVMAQQATALLTGTIKDSSGAVVPDAKVTLKNSDTNIGRTANSDKDGGFLFTLIPIGAYEVDVELAGFKKYVRTGIKLEINQNARLDVVLQVGTAAQVVEVNGNVTQVDTVSDTIGTSV